VQEFYPLAAEIKRLIAVANADLFYGPNDQDDDAEWRYPGFVSACREIKAALADVSDLWIDTFAGGATDREPEWCDGCDDEECTAQFPEDWVHYTRRDVIVCLVGSELAEYVR
jgi:hypothetical protein